MWRHTGMRPRILLALAAVTAAWAAGAVTPAAGAPLGFAPPIFVDQSLAGGEPFVTADPVHGTLVYTSHEGTTHLYQPGLATSSVLPFLVNYRDQVNIWTSKDGGKTWQIVNYQQTGFATNPANNAGFSDPDLTTDAGGRIYNTGIDLANDALFSSGDGGRTWDKGTAQCHDGDRPWLAGGKKDEVFLATNVQESNHQVFDSTDGGNSCPASGIDDSGKLPNDPNTAYSGDGKLYYVPDKDTLVEPTCLAPASGSNFCDNGVGVSTWKRGDAAFTPQGAPFHSRILAHWPAIALDSADTLYEVWDTDPRSGTTGGCSDASPTGNGASGAPQPNQVQYAYSKDLGKTWSPPFTVAAPANARAFWPWVAAGDAGRINIVWYASDKLVDLDCAKAKISIQTASITGADTSSPSVQTSDPVGRPIHDDGVCQGGTTCVATGQDRRLGDFFTNAIDSRGCVFIASGDTTQPDPVTMQQRAISLPIFLRQTSGPALIGGGDCSGTQADLGLPPSSQAVTPSASATNSTLACASRRSLVIHVRAPKGSRLSRATLYVAGKRIKQLSGRRRLSSAIRLTGLPQGTFTVRVEAVTTTGRHLVDLRRYRTCAAKRTTKPKKHTLKPKRKAKRTRG